MYLIGSVLAKALAFADTFLNLFATASLSGQVTGKCMNLPIYNAEITPCGASIATQLAGLAEIGMQALAAMLSGVLAV